jgi:phosphatidylserine/phosphatidylglycerophosphate/cardiolipin synthase-like enzyme/regulation of enolase protein 1 (concanavalin A-like superfamily)
MRRWLIALFTVIVTAAASPTASAQDRLCDPAFENCRTPLLQLIEQETVGIDVAFWFMNDARYSAALIRRFNAGVPVRVLFDPRALPSEPVEEQILDDMRAAGMPMRYKSDGGILHWKMMLFAGQHQVEFSGANFSSEAFVPIEPYADYVGEVIYFSARPPIVESFMTKYDDVWTATSGYADYANVTVRQRSYPTYPIDSSLNFPPTNNFRNRAVAGYRNETAGIDAIMYRITDRAHTDALIAAVQRGVPVRLISEPLQYRDQSRLWHSWNIDRLYVAGVAIRHRAHRGLSHEKLTLLRGQALVVFGSSNWTSPSADSQLEHNLFTTDPWFLTWASDHFQRKWANQGPVAETEPFQPLPPDTPTLKQPANGATVSGDTVTLSWYAGPWAHKYDVLIGPDPNSLVKALDDRELGPSQWTTDYRSHTISGLRPGTTYYWKIVSRTMANLSRSSVLNSFTTDGTAMGAEPLPPSWDHGDVGAVGIGGSVTFDGETFSVSASGRDIWGTSDAFHFVYTTLNGDGAIEARVATLQAADVWTKTGVMIRASLAANAAHAALFASGGKGMAFQRRPSTGGASAHTPAGAATAPQWVKLTRAGNTITASLSSDGTSWQSVGSDTIAVGSVVYIGLALTSHNDSAVAKSTIDSVVVSGEASARLPDGWAAQDVGNATPVGGASGSGDAFSLAGGGSDVWGTDDQFQFAYRSLTGDGSITARVSRVDGMEAWTKAGVMVRATLSASAPHGFALVSAAKGIAFQRRRAAAAESVHTAGPVGAAPRWVRLVRSGSTLTALTSADGSAWTVIGSDTIDLPDTVLIGLAVTSHDASRTATATFDNVSVEP